MNEYMFTKTFGIIVGMLIIFVGIGFGILSLIGMSLSKALNTGYQYTSIGRFSMVFLIIFLVFGFITMIGAFKLKSKVWSVHFIGFCMMLGIGFFITSLVSFGSLGFKNEVFILCIGVIYLGLGYLAIRKK